MRKIICTAVMLLTLSLLAACGGTPGGVQDISPRTEGEPVDYISRLQPKLSSDGFFYVDQHGELYGFGDNHFFQLSDDPDDGYYDWMHLASGVKAYYGKSGYSFILGEDGTLYTRHGVFGLSEEYGDSEYMLPLMDGIVDFSDSFYKCFAVKEDGTLLTFGGEGSYDESHISYQEPQVLMENIAAVYSPADRFSVDVWGNAYLLRTAGNKIEISEPEFLLPEIACIAGLGYGDVQLLTADGRVLLFNAERCVSADGKITNRDLPVIAEDAVRICGFGYVLSDGSFWHWARDEDSGELKCVYMTDKPDDIAANAYLKDGVISMFDEKGQVTAEQALTSFTASKG